MTCHACERRVQRALERVPGIESASASASTGVVRLTTSSLVPDVAIADAVAGLGDDYRLGAPARRPWVSRDRRVWRDVAIGVAAVALLAVLAQATGLTTIADRVGTAAAMGSLAVVAMLGVAAGFSTCMALVGGLVLAFSAGASVAARAAGRTVTGWSRWRPHLAFNGGRVLGFAVLGGLTGLVGSAFTVSGVALAVAMLAVVVVMTLLGLQLSGVSPRLGGLLPSLPDVLSARLERAADESGPDGSGAHRSGANRSGLTVRATVTAAGVGAATYVLPCGFTQAVQLYALSTGSAAQGALIMGLFALGTTPGLLAIGGLGAGLRGAWAVPFARVAGVAVLAFALVTAGGAVTLLAPGHGAAWARPGTTVSANVRLADGVQYVTTTQVADGYLPDRAVVQAGVPVVWRVTSEALTCASWLDAPALGVPAGTVLTPGATTEFRFTPAEPGRLTYLCGMGMHVGVFDVIEAPASLVSADA